MIKVKYEYSGKTFYLTPYKTSQEKDILLMETLADSDFDNALEICGVAPDIISSLTDDEKMAMLYKFREISVGHELTIKFKCVHCSTPNENAVLISDIVQSSIIKNDKIVDRYKRITDDNINEFLVNTDIDDMDIDEYEDLIKEVRNSVTKFDFKKQATCQKCRMPNHIKIDKPKLVIENMSEDSLMSLYQSYSDLTFYGKYSKIDIDSMYPFERTIFIGLLNKTREDLTK